MDKQLELSTRIFTVSFWLLAAAHLALGFVASPYGTALLIIAGLTLLAHIAEVGIFLAKYKEKSENVPLDALQVLVFGVFHLRRFQTPPPGSQE